MKKFGIKEVVAAGIGTALFVALTNVQILYLILHFSPEQLCSHFSQQYSDLS